MNGDVEPYGHRGHPSHGEVMQSDYVRQRLGACVQWLKEEGLSERESLAFVAGAAYEVALRDGETWNSQSAASETVSGLLAGRSAKFWSLRAVLRAIDDIALLRGE